jgi:hypothetical protein
MDVGKSNLNSRNANWPTLARKYAAPSVMLTAREKAILKVTIQRMSDRPILMIMSPNCLIRIKNALMWATMVFQSFLVAGEPHYDVSSSIGCTIMYNYYISFGHWSPTVIISSRIFIVTGIYGFM